MSNDLIGELSVPISQLCSMHEEWLNLDYKGKKAAEIMISCNYTPPKENWNPDIRSSIQMQQQSPMSRFGNYNDFH
jgi:hypothetical protein